MASEVPLNLYECDYEFKYNWIIDWDALDSVMQKLHTIWTFNSIKLYRILIKNFFYNNLLI